MAGDSKMLTAEDLALWRKVRAESNIGLGEQHLIDHIDAIEAQHIAAVRAVSFEWCAERERAISDRAALVALVKDFAADQIEAFIARKPCLYQEDRPPGVPEEFYSECVQCGALGPDSAYAIDHVADCSAGKLLARARAVQ